MTRLRKMIARRFGVCSHPVDAIEVFHFSKPDGNGGYLLGLTCGYLCNICMGKVNLPLCNERGDCHYSAYWTTTDRTPRRSKETA